MKKTIALFDFDGTITTIDSTKSFYKFLYKSKVQYLLFNYLYCLPLIILLKMRVINYLPLKKYRLGIHTSKLNNKEFNQLIRDFYTKVFSSLLNSRALDRIEWHKKQGHEVWIISASYDFLLTKWSLENDIRLITNETILKNGRRILINSDVNFEGKLKYLKLYINLEDYTKIYAYGDSDGDKAMLSIADFKFYKPFRE